MGPAGQRQWNLLAETVQSKSRDRFSVMFGLIEQVQELAPAMQRQSKEKAERDS